MGKVEIANCRLQSSKCKSGNRLKAVRNGVETRYIYDTAGNLIAEADGNNNITKYYIYGLGLIAMITPANQVYVYHYNAIGSTIAMTDMSRNIVNAYQYDPFGNIANQSETVTQPFKFVGQFGVMTEPNGFYYMKARYYDPNVGRFISEDPIGFAGGDVNLMAYVFNNPTNLVDPNGQIAFFWHFGITLVATGSLSTAWDAMAADRDSLNPAASAANNHAIIGEISPGNWQSRGEAMVGTNNVIQSGGATAIHAIQDLPIHNFESMEDFGWRHPLNTFVHFIKDVTGWGTISQAYQNTVDYNNGKRDFIYGSGK